MATIVLDPAAAGTYTSSGTWDSDWGINALGVDERGYAGFAVNLPDSSLLISASVTFTRTGGAGSPTLHILTSPAASSPTNTNPGWGAPMSASLGSIGASLTVGVTAQVAALLDHADWTPGPRHVAFSTGGHVIGGFSGDAQLTLVIADPQGAAALTYRLDVAASGRQPVPPPPPPWREAIHSTAYQAAITARTVTIDTRVEILDPSGSVIAQLGGPDATHGGIVGGTVSVLESRDVWWDCDLTIDQADLTPTEVGDLLHPLSHNRLRVWWRIETAPGIWVEIPVGVYYADWPSVEDSGGAGISMTVRGQDVSALISQAEMQASISVGGATVDDAVRAVLTDSAPWAPLALEPTGRRLPADYEAGEPGADPWQIARLLAQSVGQELRVTRDGMIELGPAPSPSAPPVTSIVEGPGCAAITAATSVPIGSIANRVRVDANPRRDPDGAEIEPFSVTVTDDDPTSPLWIGRGVIYDLAVSTDAVTTVEQARTMAEGLLRASQALTESGELVLFPHPHLEVGDVLDVTIASVGMLGARQVRGWSLALGDLGGQRVTVSGRRHW